MGHDYHPNDSWGLEGPFNPSPLHRYSTATNMSWEVHIIPSPGGTGTM